MKKLFALLFVVLSIACKNEKPEEPLIPEKIVYEFGYRLNDYTVIHDTLRSGENFGEILARNKISATKIHEIVTTIKDSFNIRSLKAGIAYTILAKEDTSQQAQVFIYRESKINYTIIDFKDSVTTVINGKRPIKTKIETASGLITTHLSHAIKSQGLSPDLTYKMADEVFAWAIDFSKLQKNDKFKLVYEQFYIEDTIPVGIGKIKAAYFEHNDKPFYAFNYKTDSTNKASEYYDEKANILRRQFLKMPVKFSRISSKYNLKRRIAYYGNKIKAHKGTDYAAPIGTPIEATANGTVTESRYAGGNGNYVKIKHNSTYSTQYLHMSKRAVKVGDYVKQGQTIGYIGMTGNTAGPHVCYRFWKNGQQVDPLKQKFPNSEPMNKNKVPAYKKYIEPLKIQLDSIEVPHKNILF
ncbi:MAG TPA: peptidoglycan DD-metalloendopeptidase family protein [Lutibacter sp.]|nr:peptidoglycan DD-metalloendopeptidase family protein [Lutibacter sp.]